jgi:hypothetical protein
VSAKKTSSTSGVWIEVSSTSMPAWSRSPSTRRTFQNPSACVDREMLDYLTELITHRGARSDSPIHSPSIQNFREAGQMSG